MTKRLKDYKVLTDFIKKNPCLEINNERLYCNTCNEMKTYTPNVGIRNLKRHITSAKHKKASKLKGLQTKLQISPNKPIEKGNIYYNLNRSEEHR